MFHSENGSIVLWVIIILESPSFKYCFAPLKNSFKRSVCRVVKSSPHSKPGPLCSFFSWSGNPAWGKFQTILSYFLKFLVLSIWSNLVASISWKTYAPFLFRSFKVRIIAGWYISMSVLCESYVVAVRWIGTFESVSLSFFSRYKPLLNQNQLDNARLKERSPSPTVRIFMPDEYKLAGGPCESFS